MGSFPRRLAHITPEWITSALRRADACGNASVIGFTASPPDNPGGASDSYVLDLTYDQADPAVPRPAKLFVKFAPLDEAKREMPRQYGYFPREVGFYREIAGRGGAEVPICYAAEVDEARGLFVLLLEFIESRPFGTEGLEPENAEHIIRTMARTHAAWWDSPEWPSMPWLQDARSDAVLKEALALAPLVLQLGTTLPDFLPERAARLMEQFCEGPLVTVATVTPDGPPSFTMTHGDLHQQQVLLRASSSTSAVIIDWQTAGIKPATYDVARLLSSSMDIKVRRAHEADLVNLHYDLLLSHGITNYSRETHWLQYRYSLMWTLWTNMGIVRFADLDRVRRAYGSVELWYYILLVWASKAVLDNGLEDLVPEWKRRASALAASSGASEDASRASASLPAATGTNPAKTAPMSFPRNLSEVTPEWLTSVLQKSNACGDAHVTGFTARPPPDRGSGSEHFLLDLTYDTPNPSAPVGLFVKLAPSNAETRANLHRDSYFRREVRFYQEIAGHLWCEAPRCFTAEIDEASGNFVVLLESVAARPQGRSKLEPQSVESIVRSMAALHAAWWNRADWESMPWLVDGRSDDVLRGAFARASIVMPVASTFSEFLPPAAARIMDDFARGPLVNAAAVTTEGVSAFTLTHGDLHRKQVLLGTSAEAHATIVDWQTAGIRPATYDLAQFLTSSVEPQGRRQIETDVVNLHYDLLRARGVTDYSHETHWAQYRCSLLWALWSNMCKVRFADLTRLRPLFGRSPAAMYHVLLGWPAQAVLENGLDELVPQWQRRAVAMAMGATVTSSSRLRRASTVPPPPS